MAGGAIDTRMARLHGFAAVPSRIRRAMTCAAAGVVAATIPFLAGATALVAVAVVSCLTTGT
jgi:hypothetical protein